MKNTTLILFFFLSSFLGKAQQYPKMLIDSSHWFIQMTDQTLPPTTFTHEYFLYGDTVVSSVGYKKIYYRSVNNSFDYSTYTNSFSLYALLREDTINKRVYSIMLQNLTSLCPVNQEILLYDFNLQIGDSLMSQDLCLLINNAPVSSVSSNIWIPTAKEYHLFNNYATLYQGVGSSHGLFELIGSVPGLFPYSLIDYCRGGLSNCNLIVTGLNTNTINDRSIKIFPNPLSEHFTISSKKNFEFEYQITTINGITVKKGITQSNTKIPITLNKGIYFVKIQDIKENISVTKKLIKLD